MNDMTLWIGVLIPRGTRRGKPTVCHPGAVSLQFQTPDPQKLVSCLTCRDWLYMCILRDASAGIPTVARRNCAISTIVLGVARFDTLFYQPGFGQVLILAVTM